MDKDRFDTLTRRFVDYGGSRRAVLLLAGALALPRLHALDSLTASAAAVADASCPQPSFISSYERIHLAQTFTAQHTGKLTRATIYAVAPSATNTDDYRIEIWTTNSKGKPKTGLVNCIVSNIFRPGTGAITEVTADFQTQVRVKKGRRYALAVTGLNGIPASLLSNRPAGEATSNCRGSLFEDQNGKWVQDTSTDIVFATYVTKA
jgi:hypothetical protein